MKLKFDEAISRSSAAIQRFTYPLLVDEKGVPDMLASCVFVRVSARVFLATAAHALRNRHGDGLLTRSQGKMLFQLKGNATVTRLGPDDKFDIAALAIPQSVVDEHALNVIEPEQFATHIETTNPHSRAICGFPITRNKRGQAVDARTVTYTARVYTYFGSALFTADFARFNKSEDVHVGLHYLPGKDDAGKLLTSLPSPRGMSGGGAWLVPDLDQPEQIFLEGIFIECHKNRFCFSTRLEHFLEFAVQSHAQEP